MALPQEHLKALDGLRTRLNNVIISLDNCQQHLNQSNPLPSWPELQADASGIGNAMQELTDALNSQRELFSTLHAYPNSTFPIYDPAQQGLLWALMWKQMEPNGEEWLEKSLQDSIEQAGTGGGEVLTSDQMEEVWNSAGGSTRDFVGEWVKDDVFADFYTVAEREAGVENVVTGIKKDLTDGDDDDDDDDEEEAEKKEDKAPGLPLESLLRFGSGGELVPPAPNR